MENFGMVSVPIEQYEQLVRDNQRMTLLLDKMEYDKIILEEKISMLERTIIPLLEKIVK